MCTALANTYISAVIEQSFWGCLDIAVGRGDRLCSAIDMCYIYIYYSEHSLAGAQRLQFKAPKEL